MTMYFTFELFPILNPTSVTKNTTRKMHRALFHFVLKIKMFTQTFHGV